MQIDLEWKIDCITPRGNCQPKALAAFSKQCSGCVPFLLDLRCLDFSGPQSLTTLGFLSSGQDANIAHLWRSQPSPKPLTIFGPLQRLLQQQKMQLSSSRQQPQSTRNAKKEGGGRKKTKEPADSHRQKYTKSCGREKNIQGSKESRPQNRYADQGEERKGGSKEQKTET